MSQDDSSEKKGLEEVLLENAAGLKKVSGDAGSVEQHSISDLIKANIAISFEFYRCPGQQHPVFRR